MNERTNTGAVTWTAFAGPTSPELRREAARMRERDARDALCATIRGLRELRAADWRASVASHREEWIALYEARVRRLWTEYRALRRAKEA